MVRPPGDKTPATSSPHRMRSLAPVLPMTQHAPNRITIHHTGELQNPALAAHRDFAHTTCPGRNLYSELPRLRTLIGEVR